MYEIERMTSEGWERVRAVRLAALADAPDAFATTLEQDQARAPESWRERLDNQKAATFLATSSGRDVGMVFGAPWVDRPGDAGLFAMWVAPVGRGTGVASQLIDSVIEWARAGGYRRVVLEVADKNARAIRLYERHGFAPTGGTGCLPPPRSHLLEHELALVLHKE